jgi:hypothetical protein
MQIAPPQNAIVCNPVRPCSLSYRNETCSAGLSSVQRDLLLVSSVWRISLLIVSISSPYRLAKCQRETPSCLHLVERGGNLLQELLNQINVCHDHAATAITLQAKLVHGLSIHRISRILARIVMYKPVCGALVDELQVSLPQISSHLARRWSVPPFNLNRTGRITLPHEKHRIGIIILTCR